jgi:hypothetical protein
MKKFDSLELSDEEINAIRTIVDDFENEDRPVRERQIRDWKRLELMWAGFNNFYWDYVAHDWRIWGGGSFDGSGDDNEAGYYDKNINVFRAYLETIIAALSTTVPPIKCIPDDADNVNDVLTAKGGTKIAALIYNHIDAPLLWVRMLWILSLQGMVAAYNYTDEDEKYGSVDIRESHDELVDGTQSVCPNCGTVLMEQELQQSHEIADQEKDEFDPGDDDVVLHDLLNNNKLLCPQCQIEVDPELRKDKIVITRLTGVTRQPKTRQKLEVNGGLFVKIPNWARTQDECTYLSYNYETHYTNIYEEHPELRDIMNDNNTTDTKITSEDGNQLYERWGRLSPQYRGEYPLNTPTCRNWWLRPAAFNSIKDDKLMKKMKKKFPDGCYALFVNDTFVKACNQSLDDHWTLMFNPMTNYVHYDALGTLVTAVQEITVNLVSLELQCIEHSIPQTFFNPKFLNAEQYRNTEVAPGSMYPTKTVGENRNISDGFHTLQTATVSPELAPFGAKINEMGQFVSGALPQVWGGSSGGSSRTASQYAMQRNGSQQRLANLSGRDIKFFWKNIMAKMIPAYIKDMLDDERYVEEQGENNFVNILIKKSQMEGKIGDVKLEAPEGLPATLEQMKDTVMQLLQTNNPEILSAIGSPENMPILAEVIGLEDFTVPGQADREKQFEEIGLLLMSGAIPSPDPMTGQMTEVSSIQPELTVDNHQIEAEICRNWLVGEKGRQAKTDNPNGYKNILLHLQAHMQMMQQLQNPNPNPQQSQQPPQGNTVQPQGGNVIPMRPALQR